MRMWFLVTLKKADGAHDVRKIEADSRFAVYELAKKEDATVLALEEVHGTRGFLDFFDRIELTSGISATDRILFAKNLAAMLRAGLPLARALSVLARQTPNAYLKRIITELGKGVGEGSAFHSALAAHPKVFSRLFIAMVRAGEESGGLAGALTVVAQQMENAHRLAKKVRGAMIYPAIILCTIVIIAALMLVYVVPTLSDTFASLHVQLPLATRIIVGISGFLTGNALLAGIVFVALVLGGVWVFRSERGITIVLRVGLRIPVIGDIIRETYSARAARSMASLLSSGVDMLSAISIAKEVVGARVFSDTLASAEVLVKKGEPLSAAFAAHTKLYPPLFSEMIMVGEETGGVAPMLQQVAEYYEGSVEEKTKDLSTIIEPVLMLIIGAAVGVFAIAMIMPIYSITAEL